MGFYFEQDPIRTLADRLAADAAEKVRSAISGDTTLRVALKEIQAAVESQTRRQIEDERGRDSLAHRTEIEVIRDRWREDVRGRSEYLTRIERRRAHLHSALLKVNLRLASIVGMCGDDELKAAILDVQADIKGAIDKQADIKEEEPT